MGKSVIQREGVRPRVFALVISLCEMIHKKGPHISVGLLMCQGSMESGETHAEAARTCKLNTEAPAVSRSRAWDVLAIG